jgi:hypothetical protein
MKKGYMMKEINIMKKAPEVLRKVFEAIPFVRSTEIGSSQGLPGPDFTIALKLDNSDVTILVEAKNSGQPRLARNAVNQLLRFRSERPDAYPVFLAPYISPSAGKICREAGTGYIDMAGNCYLAFGSVFINREGKKNPYASSRKLKSLYQPVSSRVLRVLLSDPGKAWKTQPLSDEAGVSLGQIANVKQALKDREWIEEGPDGFNLTSPDELLADWSKNYFFRKNTINTFYAMDGTTGAEQKIADACSKLGVQYALTSFSGAARLAPNVRYKRSDIYVADKIEVVAEAAGLKQVDTGSNLRLLGPYDEGVFYKATDIKGLQVACPVQVYLDVLAQRGRGEEAAESILKDVIKKSW